MQRVPLLFFTSFSFHHAFISRADDLIHTDQFFNAVRAPTDDPRRGEHSREQFDRDAEHIVNESAVKVNVRATVSIVEWAISEKLELPSAIPFSLKRSHKILCTLGARPYELWHKIKRRLKL